MKVKNKPYHAVPWQLVSMMKKMPGLKMFFSWQLYKTVWLSLVFTEVNKYLQTSAAAVHTCHIKVKISDENFLNFPYVINRTCTETCSILVT